MADRNHHDRRAGIRPHHPIVAILIAALKDRGEIAAKGAAELPEVQALWSEEKDKQKLMSITSYHLNTMEQRGLVEVSRRVPVRGVHQTFFRLTEKGIEMMSDDSLALDRIAATLRSGRDIDQILDEIRQVIESSGR